MNKDLIAAVRNPKKGQAGVAAVELAILMPILLGFLLFPIMFAQCFWHYTMAQKAAQDAARYLSTVPAAEMMQPELAKNAAELALEIVERELAEVAPDVTVLAMRANCNAVACDGIGRGTLPTTVNIQFQFTMFDTFFGVVDFGWNGLPITADVTMRYVGN